MSLQLPAGARARARASGSETRLRGSQRKNLASAAGTERAAHEAGDDDDDYGPRRLRLRQAQRREPTRPAQDHRGSAEQILRGGCVGASRPRISAACSNTIPTAARRSSTACARPATSAGPGGHTGTIQSRCAPIGTVSSHGLFAKKLRIYAATNTPSSPSFASRNSRAFFTNSDHTLGSTAMVTIE